MTRIATPFVALAALCLVITAPVQATHPRPKGATPLRVALVPAYAQCTASNRTHGPPLAFPSCNPPAQTSAQATVGTPDAFGGAANSAGSIRLSTILCQSNCPTDDGDVLIDVVLEDVRCKPTGAPCGSANATGPADYTGELRFSFTARVTDHWNAAVPGGGTDAATVQDFAIKYNNAIDGIPIACAGTASASVGSYCATNTSLNANVPGAVKGGKREVWALDAVRISDGGTDGDGDTAADNTVFARPGLFVP